MSICAFGGSCDPTTYTFVQQRTYYSKVFARTPQAACTSYVANTNFGQPLTQAQKDSAIAYPVNATTYQCTYDYDRDGHVYGIPGVPTPPNAYDDWAQNHANIDMAGQTEAMCDRVPNGPYTVATDPYTTYGIPGKNFTQSMKNYAKSVNNGSSNFWYSDAWMYMPPAGPGGVSQIVDYYYKLNAASVVNYMSSVQVDHIIPRVDIFGCACGPNSLSNAMLISAKLNGEMSNDSQHPKRKFLLATWTKAFSAREIDDAVSPDSEIETIDEAIDEASDEASDEADLAELENEIGGCSTGGRASGFGVIIVGLALGLRRRKS